MRSLARYAFYGCCAVFLLLGSIFSLLFQLLALIFGGITFLLPWGLSLRLSCSQVRR
ncbi:MAG: hypothetical protein WC497_05260 [Patescibacteria group bacterium]